jgi:hypothetical protein
MDDFDMTAATILNAMDIQGDTKPGNPWVGSALSQFSLPSIRPPYPRKNVDGHTRKVTVYPFNSAHILKMYEIYMRETPPNHLSRLSHTENSNDSNGSHGTGKKQGTSPNLSQPVEPDTWGQAGTCPTGKGCPTEPIEFITDSDVGQAGQVKKGDVGGGGDCIVVETI